MLIENGDVLRLPSVEITRKFEEGWDFGTSSCLGDTVSYLPVDEGRSKFVIEGCISGNHMSVVEHFSSNCVSVQDLNIEVQDLLRYFNTIKEVETKS